MRILRIFISPEHIYIGHHGGPSGSTPVEEVSTIECISGKGIRGDRYFDHKPDYKGQITFFSREVYDGLCIQFGVVDREPKVFRRNVLVEGVDLNSLIGTEFEVQGVRFFGTEECRPCDWMNEAFHDGAHDALRGHGGLRARILTDGTLTCDPA